MIIIISLNERLIWIFTKLYSCVGLLRECLVAVQIGSLLFSIRIVYSKREVKMKYKRKIIFFLVFTMCTYRSLYESLLSVTGVWCIDLMLATRERSLLRYRRISALQVYAEVPVFQLDRGQLVFHQGQ